MNADIRRWCSVSLRFVCGIARLAGFSLITVPAVVFFLVMIAGATSPGDRLLQMAESLVRDAPRGMVMACPYVPPATDQHGKPLPPPAVKGPCVPEPLPREVWVARTNENALFVYQFAVVLGVLSGIYLWSRRREIKKEDHNGQN